MTREARSEATFQYKVENISKKNETELSPPCYIRNLPWRIKVLPRAGVKTRNGLQKGLGFYLECNGESKSASWSCFANVELRLLSCKKNQKPFALSKLLFLLLIF